ncbi:MAG: VWA domain-containing protein [Patescibacteria group bacterium]
MAKGHYDNEAHQALTQARVNLPTEQVFRGRSLNPRLNPYGLKFRECRYSTKHPKARPIMMVADDSGSMGDIPHYWATVDMPHFLELVLKGGFLESPQPMIVGVNDVGAGAQAPLQVGQFEGEAHLIDQDLTSLFIQGGGGSIPGESYELPFYVAARHASCDCYEKDGLKGYMFTFGDEPPFPWGVRAREVEQVIGDKLDRDIPFPEIVAEANQKFHCFFLIPDEYRRRNCEREWRNLLGDNVICLETHEDACTACAVIIGLTEGVLTDLSAVSQSLEAMGCDEAKINRIIRAVAPYAASLDRGGKVRRAGETRSPSGQGKSGNRRR